MPLDRLFHAVAGHSEKVNRLNDLEFRVWAQYLLSADDFGVMRLSPVQIQSDNDRLAEVSTRKLMAALEKLVEVGLLLTFEHQGKRFVYQWNWQKYQKVEYPRTTTMPRPSDVSACDSATQWLFGVHPGGKRLPKQPEEVAEQLPTTSQEVASLARAHAHPTANANGQRPTANGQRPTAVVPMRGYRKGALGSSPADHIGHAKCNDRGVCIPTAKFLGELMGRFGNDVVRFEAFYASVIDNMPDDFVPTGTVFEFWHDMLKRAFPDSAPVRPSARTAAMNQEW